jgi:cell division protein FtsL
MAGYLTITNKRTHKKGARRGTLPMDIKIGPVTFIVSASIIFAFIGFLFLAQLFQTSTKGYEISKLREQLDKLKEENKKLEIETAELRSFENIDGSIEKLNMVRSQNVVYLKKVGSTIVVANK